MSVIKRFTTLSISILLLMSVGCSTSQTKETNIATNDLIISKSTTYNTATAEQTDFVRSVSTKVEPVFIDRRTIISGSETLTLKSLEVKRGDIVKQNDVLAILSGTGSESDVKQLNLELDFALASYEETCSILEGSIAMTQQTTASDSYAERIKELNIAKQQASYELYKLNTEASLKSLRDRLKKAKDALGDTYIYAPFDGIIRSLENKAVGDVLDPGTPLMMMSKTDSLVLYSNTAVDMFMYNKEIDITVGSGDDVKAGTGRVVSSSNLLPSYLGSFVYIKLEDPGIIGSSSDANASCEYTLLRDVVIIPRSGINSDNGMYYVILLDGNTTRKRYVIRGPQLPTEIAIFQGIKAGDMVVTSQYTS